jgi:hypothetical protein
MENPKRRRAVFLVTLAGAAAAALVTAGVVAAGCSQPTFVDMYFGTDAGAGFVAPPREICDDAGDCGDGGADADAN